MRKFYRSLAWCALALVMGCGSIEQSATDASANLSEINATSKSMLVEIRASRKSLEKATEQSVRLADALVQIKDLGVDLTQILKTFFVAQPTKPTDDIDAVLK